MSVAGTGSINPGIGGNTSTRGDEEKQNTTTVVVVTSSEGEGDELPEESPKKLPSKLILVAWVLLVVELVVIGALYANGGGRTVAITIVEDVNGDGLVDAEDTTECETAGGKPAVAQAIALRAVAAVVAQLGTFCCTDRGLLKPFEAMWQFFASFMRRCGIVLAVTGSFIFVETEETWQDQHGNRTKRTNSNGCCACMTLLIMSMIPAVFVWNFSFFPATLYLVAVCNVVDRVVFLASFQIGSFFFLMMCSPVLYRLTGGSDAEQRKSIKPYASALTVLDSVVIGITCVWGNYVQSGVVAGFFGLLPAFNLYLTCKEHLL